MTSVIKYIVERLAERTTWVGLLAALGMAVSWSTEQLQVFGDLGVAVAAAILVFFKDKLLLKKDETAEPIV